MDTLVEQIEKLKQKGIVEEFSVEGNKVITKSGKKFDPEDLIIKETYRFEGESNPSDSSDLFVIEANDGTKGSLITSHGAKHSQNVEVIRKIRIEN